MIIYAGENVYPAEVENALASHPAVQEVAVIGVPDPAWGERIKAVVVLSPGRSARPAELLAHARRRLADFKVPHAVAFVDALPRTPSGKVKNHELRRAHAQPGG
jgi:acyl-CoA synthetase (AMP-forming)/AMP-acid ligase II